MELLVIQLVLQLLIKDCPTWLEMVQGACLCVKVNICPLLTLISSAQFLIVEDPLCLLHFHNAARKTLQFRRFGKWRFAGLETCQAGLDALPSKHKASGGVRHH